MFQELESFAPDLLSPTIGASHQKRIGTPVRGGISDAGSYAPHVYQEEKMNGERRPNGVKPLKRLKGQHRLIIQLAVQGLSCAEISRQVGKSYGMVYQTLSDPLAQREIEISLAASRHQLRALQVRGIEVIGSALRSELPETQLKGVDRLMKMQEIMGVHSEGKETAEDVARKLMAAIQVNVNVNSHAGRVAHVDVPECSEVSIETNEERER